MGGFEKNTFFSIAAVEDDWFFFPPAAVEDDWLKYDESADEYEPISSLADTEF